ncbi:uncharacterized protein PFL1_05130 [Pseudozyma flocculosa PF-1]|uniref:Related to alpha/beta hydrolase n=2 Tax=Pseudozyma flocculosa TaxID=84751 RepID=A0A5C3F608_9BASI|nr:uncharacterized protein PFL1_05130 [Pseudozyma flocculosa PF-1]EPQ27207.1 hypothetical protein PFL1_05130 [Pseudozyma flocculosa PF-1]SPO39570.1 related to alpha/beta hydrolase [Pseudozyma flocculosa]
MATALLPYGAAYAGATQELLDEAKKAEGDAYLPTVFNPATVTQRGVRTLAKGRVPASKDGKEGFGCYHEVHGSGPIKVVFVMGLNNSCFGWLPQVEHLSKDPRYSCLVIDNRGVGNSDTPAGLYKTSEMALDVIELLEQLGWAKPRSIHLVGVSMGGMISLEFARTRPDLLASVSLISTTPGKRYGTPSYGLRSLVRVLGGRVVGFDSESYRLNRLIETLFPIPWLEEKSKYDQNKTNRQILFKMFAWRFQFTRRQTLHGAVAQMKAAVTHNVPDSALQRINTAVPKIVILTGDTDYLVDPRNSQYLADKMPNAELIKFQVAGHALGNQFDERVNTILERVIGEGREAVEREGVKSNL